ncbi:Siderophore iron transporter mirC [Yarrowia sp. C11]|nr:Siderophore iron transporter mirC [Yarrowia sp. C11]KAG5364199.1 Siderophore iron transporter mirC [Yarrowia sp. E02]
MQSFKHYLQVVFNPQVERAHDEDDDNITDGVKEMEHLNKIFSKTELVFAWASLLLVSVCLALESQTVNVYSTFAISHFNELSLLSALAVVKSVMYTASRPTVAKLADVLGRFEALVISVVFFTVGFVMLAACKNIGTYFAAHIFYVSGQVGIQFMEQVFAADTSSLKNRLFFVSLPNFAFLFAPWIAAPITNAITKHSTWRWGYGMWCIVMPVVAIPVCCIMLRLKFKARKMGLEYGKTVRNFKETMRQFDIIGLILFTGGLTLLFLAVTLATGPKSWSQAHILAMIIIGPILLVVFPFWEMVPKYPFMPFYIIKNRTMLTCCFLICCYSIAYFLYGTYYMPWLMVCKNLSVTAATNTSVCFVVASTVSSFVGAAYTRFTNKVKPVVCAGAALYLLGLGLTFHYRQPKHHLGQFIVAQCVEGVGSGMMQMPMLVMLQSVVSHKNVVSSTAIYLSIMTVGTIIGEAISGSMYRQSYPKQLAEFAPFLTSEQTHMVANNVKMALKYQWDTPERMMIVTAFNNVYRRMLYPPIIIASVIFLGTLTLPDVDVGVMDEAQNHTDDEHVIKGETESDSMDDSMGCHRNHEDLEALGGTSSSEKVSLGAEEEKKI